MDDDEGARSREQVRNEIREANRQLWQPICHLLWRPDGTSWSTLGSCLVVLSVLTWAKSVFNLYTMLQGWEHRPAYGLVIIPSTMGCVITRALLTIANPCTGELVQMCSFQPATVEEIEANRKMISRNSVLAVIFALLGAAFISLPLFTDALKTSDIRLQPGEYGGHGDRWIGYSSYIFDVAAFMWTVVPVTIMFVYTLRFASSVAVSAARYVVKAIDNADRDVETNVSETLRLEIGPCVQTLVEEILLPLSTGWGLPVRTSIRITCGM